MPPRYRLIIMLPTLILPACHPAWRPTTEHLQQAKPQSVINLTHYGLYQTNIDLRYSVTNHPHAADPVDQHIRLRKNQSQTGILIDRTNDDLTRYLAPPEGHPPQSMNWPEKNAETAVFLSFDPPLPLAPETIHADQPAHYESTVWLFNRHGYPVAKGHVTRTTALEGFETITTTIDTYPDAARLLITTDFKFPWGTQFTITDYHWLAHDIGEVSRIRNIKGSLFFIGFTQTQKRQLLTITPKPNHTLKGPNAWQRTAITLNKFLPNPNLTGLVIDLTEHQSQK